MRSVLLSTALLLLSAPASGQSLQPDVAKRIDRILRRTPLIDGHNDLPEQLRENYRSSVDGLASGTAEREPPLMTDIARLRAGRVGAQFWSVYINAAVQSDEAIRQTIEQIDTVTRLVEAYPRDLELASTADDIVRIHRQGRIASLIGIEGGHQIGANLAALRQFHRLGARYMTLTHSKATSWADSATDDPKHGGLTPFGLAAVREMNRLGMLVDLSHVAPSVMRQAIAASRAPVIFSHSGARALNDHPRNVPDDVLKLLPANGGVVMINFYPSHLSEDVRQWGANQAAEEARLKALFTGQPERIKSALDRWTAANPRPRVTVSMVADHVDHVARTAGHDHVGIGGDLDGIPSTVEGLDGVDGYPLLFAELIQRGWSDRNLAKLAGGNVLRAIRAAEATARSMRDVRPALDTLPAAMSPDTASR